MLGKVLKQYRKTHKMTQRFLSRISGVDRDLISRIERGTEKADKHTQALLVNALLRLKTPCRYEKAHGWERGEQLGLLLSTLSPEMADSVYMDIINKLKDYVGFQIDVSLSEDSLPLPATKHYRKYTYFKL